MARTNYGFAKRQRDLAKKQKKEQKRLKKLAAAAPPEGEPVQASETEEGAPVEPATPAGMHKP